MTRDVHESAAAFALGASDPPELAALEALFASDATFRREVEQFREVAGLLAYAAPSVAAPTSLRQRIVAQASAVRPITSATTVNATAAQTSARRITAVLPWLAAAAAVGFAFISGNRLRDAQVAMSELRGELVNIQSELSAKDSTLAAFMGPEVHVVSLSESTQRPSARVYWNQTKRVFIVTAFSVPRAPDGKTYQLWAIAKGKNPMSMGTFNTDASGRATLVVPVGNTVLAGGTIDLCALTMEPTGGSPQPTETPRLVGNWRHTD